MYSKESEENTQDQEKFKTCNVCGEIKLIDLFRAKRRVCKMCERQQKLLYYKKNKEKNIAYSKKYRIEHYATVKAGKTKWNKENAEKVKQMKAESYKRHAEHVKQWGIEYRKKNDVKCKLRWAKYYLENPDIVKRPTIKITDAYVKGIIRKVFGLKNIPKDLIISYREQILLHRKLKTKKNENTKTS